MNMQDAFKAVIPIVVACIAWLLGEVSGFQSRLTKIEGQMPILITAQGVPTDSPISAEARHRLKEDVFAELHSLQVRMKLMEEKLRGAK